MKLDSFNQEKARNYSGLFSKFVHTEGANG